MPETPDIPEDVKQLMATEKVARQFRDVFGMPPGPGEGEKRSESQIAVWEAIMKAGNMHQTVFMPDRAGQMCSMRAAFADGQRWMALYIKANVEYTPKIVQS